MKVSRKRPFSRDQRTVIVYGMLVFVLILVILQLWLLTATISTKTSIPWTMIVRWSRLNGRFVEALISSSPRRRRRRRPVP